MEQRLVERRDRGVIRHASSVYGRSVDGSALTAYLPGGDAKLLILAAIHGDDRRRPWRFRKRCAACRGRRSESGGDPVRCAERAATHAASISIATSRRRTGVPIQSSTRAGRMTRDIALSPGPEPSSEPETRALIALIDRLQPRAVVALHSVLACAGVTSVAAIEWIDTGRSLRSVTSTARSGSKNEKVGSLLGITGSSPSISTGRSAVHAVISHRREDAGQQQPSSGERRPLGPAATA